MLLSPMVIGLRLAGLNPFDLFVPALPARQSSRHCNAWCRMLGAVCFITILLTGYLSLLSTGNCEMRYDLEDHMDTSCRHTAGIHVIGLLCACDLSDCEKENNDEGKIVG